MASIQQASPPALQPTIEALRAVIAAVETMAGTPGAALDSTAALNTDAGTTSAAYLSYKQISNLLNLQLTTLIAGQSTQQVVQQGGSFYEIAAQYYGDITQAFAVMYANGFFTPWIPNAEVVVANLPPAQTLMPATGISAPQVTPPVTTTPSSSTSGVPQFV